MGAMVEEEEEEREEGRRNVEGEKGQDGERERERERKKTGYIHVIVSMSQEVPNIKFSDMVTLIQWQFCASHQPWAR